MKRLKKRNKQTAVMSGLEVFSSIFTGFLINCTLAYFIFRGFGMYPSPMDTFTISIFYLCAAFARGYIIRRFFEGTFAYIERTKTLAWVESITNVVFSYFVALTVQRNVLPYFDMNPSWEQSIQIEIVFMCIGLVRTYLFRRVFEAIKNRKKDYAVPRIQEA